MPPLVFPFFAVLLCWLPLSAAAGLGCRSSDPAAACTAGSVVELVLDVDVALLNNDSSVALDILLDGFYFPGEPTVSSPNGTVDTPALLGDRRLDVRLELNATEPVYLVQLIMAGVWTGGQGSATVGVLVNSGSTEVELGPVEVLPRDSGLSAPEITPRSVVAGAAATFNVSANVSSLVLAAGSSVVVTLAATGESTDSDLLAVAAAPPTGDHHLVLVDVLDPEGRNVSRGLGQIATTTAALADVTLNFTLPHALAESQIYVSMSNPDAPLFAGHFVNVSLPWAPETIVSGVIAATADSVAKLLLDTPVELPPTLGEVGPFNVTVHSPEGLMAAGTAGNATLFPLDLVLAADRSTDVAGSACNVSLSVVADPVPTRDLDVNVTVPEAYACAAATALITVPAYAAHGASAELTDCFAPAGTTTTATDVDEWTADSLFGSGVTADRATVLANVTVLDVLVDDLTAGALANYSLSVDTGALAFPPNLLGVRVLLPAGSHPGALSSLSAESVHNAGAGVAAAALQVEYYDERSNRSFALTEAPAPLLNFSADALACNLSVDPGMVSHAVVDVQLSLTLGVAPLFVGDVVTVGSQDFAVAEAVEAGGVLVVTLGDEVMPAVGAAFELDARTPYTNAAVCADLVIEANAPATATAVLGVATTGQQTNVTVTVDTAPYELATLGAMWRLVLASGEASAWQPATNASSSFSAAIDGFTTPDVAGSHALTVALETEEAEGLRLCEANATFEVLQRELELSVNISGAATTGNTVVVTLSAPFEAEFGVVYTLPDGTETTDAESVITLPAASTATFSAVVGDVFAVASASVALAPSALDSVGIGFSHLEARVETQLVVSFSTDTALGWIEGSAILVELPRTMILTTATLASPSSADLSIVDSNVLSVTGSSGPAELVVDGIVNAPVGSTESFNVTLVSGEGVAWAAGTVPGVQISSASLESAAWVPADGLAGVHTDVELTLRSAATSFDPVLLITAPPGWSWGLNSTGTVVDDETLLLELDFPSSEDVVVLLTDCIAPVAETAAATTALVALYDDGGGSVVIANASVEVPRTRAGEFSGVDPLVQLVTPYTGETTEVRLDVQTRGWALRGYLLHLACPNDTYSFGAGMEARVDGQTANATRVGSSEVLVELPSDVAPGSALTLSITEASNPAVIELDMPTGNLSLLTGSGGGVVDGPAEVELPSARGLVSITAFPSSVDFGIEDEWEVALSTPISPDGGGLTVTLSASRIDFGTNATFDDAHGEALVAFLPVASGATLVQLELAGPDSSLFDADPELVTQVSCVGATTGTVCDQCLAGTFRDASDECADCPALASCSGGDSQPTTVPGHWLTAELVVIECSPTEACAGNNTCSEGYLDLRCAECNDGFYRLDGYCEMCPEQGWLLVLGLLGALIAAVAIMLYVYKRAWRELKYFGPSLNVVLDYLQVVAVFSGLGIWPKSVRATMTMFSVVNFNFDVGAPECVGLAYSTKWFLLQSLPILVVGVVFGLGYLQQMRGTSAIQWANIARDGLNVQLLITRAMYLSLVSSATEVFDCVPQGDGSFVMESQPDIYCSEPFYQVVAGNDTSVHRRLVPWATLALAMYGFGIPLAYSIILFRRRKSIHELHSQFLREHTIDTRSPAYGIRALFEHFKPHAYWWSVIIIFRKAALAWVLLIWSNRTVFQLVTMICILQVASALQLIYRPLSDNIATLGERLKAANGASSVSTARRRWLFAERRLTISNNAMESVSLHLCLFTLLSGVMFAAADFEGSWAKQTLEALVTALLILCTCLFFLLVATKVVLTSVMLFLLRKRQKKGGLLGPKDGAVLSVPVVSDDDIAHLFDFLDSEPPPPSLEAPMAPSAPSQPSSPVTFPSLFSSAAPASTSAIEMQPWSPRPSASVAPPPPSALPAAPPAAPLAAPPASPPAWNPFDENPFTNETRL